MMPKGGNGGGSGGGGKPDKGGDDGGSGGGLSWRGSRGDDTIYIVDDATASGTDEFTVSQFLTGSFDGWRGNDTLDFSRLTSGGISIELSHDREVSFDQGYLGFLIDFRTAGATFVSADFVGFENVVGTSGNDSISGFTGALSVIDGGAGDDRIRVGAQSESVVIGGQGSDQLGGYGLIYVGGEWDQSYARQAGDNTTDIFIDSGVILDFELPTLDGSFDGDKLVISGMIGSNNASALDDMLAKQFETTTWMAPDGTVHEGAVLKTLSGDGPLFTLVGVSAEDANALIMPNVSFHISTTEAGFMLSGSSNDDWFELPDAGNQVLFELQGGNDTLLYGEFADPTDDTLFFEGSVIPENWTFEQVDGVDTWSADYNGQTITIVGLDQAGFDALTMVALDTTTSAQSETSTIQLSSTMLASNDLELMSALYSNGDAVEQAAQIREAEVPSLIGQLVDEISSEYEVDQLLDHLLGTETANVGLVPPQAIQELLSNEIVPGNGAIFASPLATEVAEPLDGAGSVA